MNKKIKKGIAVVGIIVISGFTLGNICGPMNEPWNVLFNTLVGAVGVILIGSMMWFMVWAAEQIQN